jgi:hypothetical protein
LTPYNNLCFVALKSCVNPLTGQQAQADLKVQLTIHQCFPITIKSMVNLFINSTKFASTIRGAYRKVE